eukprot:scaffold2380_cov380-Prasinococcus_capsulatus_cf.AAC.6
MHFMCALCARQSFMGFVLSVFAAAAGAQANKRVLHHHTLVRGDAETFANQIVDERIGLLPGYVVASNDLVETSQALLTNDRVDHLEEARLREFEQ